MADTWFYFSFADPARPKGTQFLGGCYVRQPQDAANLLLARVSVAERRGCLPDDVVDDQAVAIAAALAETHRLGINPGGEVQSLGPLPTEIVEANVPLGDRERLLTQEEINP